MFSTVCTRYIHVALAAYVPMLWERFTFGHSCNYSVVLSKNVSTWNKKKYLVIFIIFISMFSEEKTVWYWCLTHRKLFSHEWPWWTFNLFHNDVHQNNDQCALLVCRISKFAWKNKSCLHFLSAIPLFWLRLGMVPFVEEMGSEEAVGN